MNAAIPIFILTCNRIAVLEQSLASYEQRIQTPHEIVIHDNHSTYAPMVDYLNSLERSGIKVYRSPVEVTDAEQLNNVAQSISDWFSTHDAPYYVVTDPDVEIDENPGDILEFYAHLLDTMPDIDVVGPLLRTDDLPDHYPLKNTVIQRRQLAPDAAPPLQSRWRDLEVNFYRAPVDTTFGMYRKNYTFHRLSSGVRVLKPYDARHLDWYLDPNQLTDDQRYYFERASEVGHWGSSWLKRYLQGQHVSYRAPTIDLTTWFKLSSSELHRAPDSLLSFPRPTTLPEKLQSNTQAQRTDGARELIERYRSA